MLVITWPKRTDRGKNSLLAAFVTESGNVETREVRPKVGSPKPVTPTLLLLDLRRHEKHALDLSVLPGIQDDPLQELRSKAEAAKKKEKEAAAGDEGKKKGDEEKGADKEKDKKPRPVELAAFFWSDDGSRLALELRSYDNKDRWLATVEPSAQPVVVPRHRLTDPAWINWDFNELGWLRDNTTLWYLSEESGTAHLYLLSTSGGAPRQMTHGAFEVSNPYLDRDGRYLYYTANAAHPGRYDVWRLELASGRSEQLSRLGGLTTFRLSPHDSRLLLPT